MTIEAEKPAAKATLAPCYGSFKTAMGVLNGLREAGADHIPPRIDKTVMPTLSGSAVNETIAVFKYLGLVQESGATGASFDAFVMASDEARKPLLAAMLKKSYGFIFNPQFDIERATSGMVVEAFRKQQVNGSTLSRAIAFFLSATKEANIKVSPNIKAPRPESKPAVAKGSKEKGNGDAGETPPADDQPPPPEGVHKFELPIPGKRSVLVYIPEELNGDDWEMFSQMFSLYVSHWKKFPGKQKSPDSK